MKSDTVLRSSVDNIITLALEGNHLCRLIAKHGGVRSLLTICVDPKRRNVRVNAFRALGMYYILYYSHFNDYCDTLLSHLQIFVPFSYLGHNDVRVSEHLLFSK